MTEKAIFERATNPQQYDMPDLKWAHEAHRSLHDGCPEIPRAGRNPALPLICVHEIDGINRGLREPMPWVVPILLIAGKKS